MAFLLLLHEKMRLRRKVNKLTLQQSRYGNRLDRMTKNISRVQKMYSSKMTQLDKIAQMAQSQFKAGLMNQMGIGTQGLNPMNFGGMGGTSIFAVQGYNKLASQLQGDGVNIGTDKEENRIKLDNALPIIQAMVSGGGATQNYTDAAKKEINKEKPWKVGNYELTDEQYNVLNNGIYQVKAGESQASFMASQISSQYESRVSLWLEAAKAQLEAEQDEALAPLEAEQTDMELEKDSVETQLTYARERLQALEQACSQEIKDSAPKFGLG